MKNKGFTLIELIAVIIILAVIALISTPIVLNVIEDAKEKSNLNSVYGIIDGARLYFAESLLDETKLEDINNNRNIYGKVIMQGEKPAEGYLYADKNGMIGVAVIYGNKCYKKGFAEEKVSIHGTETCELGYVGEDSDLPSVVFEVQGTPFNEENWANVNFFVKIMVSDKTSGVASYKWCVSNSECDPSVGAEVKGETNTVSIINESASNQICVIARDNKGNTTEKKCSELYKLDKTKPQIGGIGDIRINKGESVNLETNVTKTDTLSGISIFTYNPTSVDTSKAGTTLVTYKAIDNAGNETVQTRQVIVDAEGPIITYTVQGNPFNASGWSKSDFYVKGNVTDNSGLGIKESKWCLTTENTCIPNATISGTEVTPLINTSSASNRICITTTDNNNKTTNLCSDSYKLDKTAPNVGNANISGTMGSNSWYTSNVAISPSNGSDSLSGHLSTTVDIASITSNISGINVTVTTTDNAGNQSTKIVTVKVDKTSPTLTAKDGTYEITQGDNVASSTYFNSPSYSISGGSMSCSPTNTSSLAVGSRTVTCTATGGNGLKTSASKTITVKSKIYADTSGASKPELTEKLIPVKWNGSAWVYADISQKWYDYNSKEWANAVVLNSGVSKTVGQTIAISEIAMMYVWIPRYEYKLPAASIGTTGTPQALDIKFIDKNKTIPTSGYSMHPGFKFGTENKNGIWFGKFETSGTPGQLKIIPNVSSLRHIIVSTMFNASRTEQTNYNLTGMNIHMTKYTEWTAVSYLTNSIYGRCSSLTICTEVTINNSSSFITGNAGNSISAGSASGTTNAYNTTNGQLASTTGNIYGIYDMSGGASEYVMGTLSGVLGSSGFKTLPERKYYDLFTTINLEPDEYITYGYLSEVNGEKNYNGILSEILSNKHATTTWYYDGSNFLYIREPWFTMGGNFVNGESAGIFKSAGGEGYSHNTYGFRLTILTEN